MREVFTFHIQLAGISPAIWRRLEIRAEGTFWHLHCAIQDAMPWEAKHLHEFHFPTGDEEARIGLPEFDEFAEDPALLASQQTSLKDWFFVAPAQCLYVYDFGDDWLHTITLESQRPARAGERFPRCTGGARRCPPEDVGGPLGYTGFLEALANRRHREHRSYREWISGSWDPEEFRQEEIVFAKPGIRLRQAGLA